MESVAAVRYARGVRAAWKLGVYVATVWTHTPWNIAVEAVLDPIFLSLATALASRFGNEGAGAAWSALVRLVRGRAAAGTSMKRALESAQAAPEQNESIRQLADELQRIADSDTDFGRRIHELWPTADRELAATNTQNQISGVVLGNAIQAGTLSVEGDLNFDKR